MGKVPEAYYAFVTDYAPYVYVVPPSTPDQEWGRAAFAAAFAIDFLYEAYGAEQFSDYETAIYNKIVSLADWILTQQCTEQQKRAYGGFKSAENSTYYYAVDACRVIPALLKAYELTGNNNYLNAAKLAATFLKTMQEQQPYGGFARAVDINGNWLLQLDVECLYGLLGLKMLAEKYDVANASLYQNMMRKAADFLREGFDGLWLYYDPSDGKWHRVGLAENEVYDDCFAYALLGLYVYEGWSPSCQKVYNFLNSIGTSARYPAYNPAVCWAGYIDVVSRFPACDYYDGVTAGILWQVRKHHDKPSLAYSMKIIEKYAENFMFWGVKHADYSPVEEKWAMATVCWLARFFLNYEEPLTRFMQVLRAHGRRVTLYPLVASGESANYGEGVEIQAFIAPARVDEVFLEPGYVISDYITVYTFVPLRVRDKILVGSIDYEVLSVQAFDWRGETAYFRASCRRLNA
ncbi:MAG: D-glucuronyl C5-epimerase family protein [Candidatus Bathyarchaeia archaeon]